MKPSTLEGIAPSIGTVGDAYDNALMESIIGLFKPNAPARAVPHRAVQDHRRRRVRHLGRGPLVEQQGTPHHPRRASPAEFEQAHCAALNIEMQPI